MQDLATVNHVSFFIKIKMESTSYSYGYFPKTFQAHEYSELCATWYINSEVVIPPNGHCLRSRISDIS